jgi:hydroxyacyl-ACP dehydratase HTD2-like protein with hotdog domain
MTLDDLVSSGSDPELVAYPHRQLRWSTTGLFRFSALTFNGHKVHYDEPWTRRVEGHRAPVVHGPLNLICMLDYWRDACGEEGDLQEIKYRAMSPLYAGDTYRISTAEPTVVGRGKEWEILVERDEVTCMKGTILGR